MSLIIGLDHINLPIDAGDDALLRARELLLGPEARGGGWPSASRRVAAGRAPFPYCPPSPGPGLPGTATEGRPRR